jgi:hypothetical protein
MGLVSIVDTSKYENSRTIGGGTNPKRLLPILDKKEDRLCRFFGTVSIHQYKAVTSCQMVKSFSARRSSKCLISLEKLVLGNQSFPSTNGRT